MSPEDYDVAGAASDNRSALSLLKGAMRAITGYIGRSNRDGYRIETPTATIGIRGTDHEPAYYPPPERGEHNEEVLHELGYDDARIAELKELKIVVGTAPGGSYDLTGRVVGRLNNTAAEADLVIIDHHRLAGRDRPLRLVKLQVISRRRQWLEPTRRI